MALVLSPRFGLPTWNAGGDTPTRVVFNTIAEILGASGGGAAGFAQGAGTASPTPRPTAAAAVKGFFYYDTSGLALYYCDGSSWIAISGGTVSHAQLAADAVETENIKNLNVTTAKIADEAVTSGKILSLVATKLTGTIPNSVAYPVGPEEHKTYWGATLEAATVAYSKIYVTTDSTPNGGVTHDICLVYTA